ncbi:MAG: hypothetical protein BGP06_09225 [Rhizobiales bacterium 65-9]|nr:ABC transporter ATP-binding protein [Hyphomicrobiales bacterium]OJY38642.1 MAG: hypothetical protein BGP06_09225 [Rhizobiales bacterium 65-9]
MALSIRGLSFSYGAVSVLRGVDVEALPRGSVAALVGPNGSGKSTLFRCLAGLLPAKTGAASLDAVDLGAYSPRERSRRVFYLGQDMGAHAALSVFEIVLLARKSLGGGLAIAASPRDVAMTESVIDDLGLRALASRDIGSLSSGQRQLAGIAQAIVREPDVLLLDEPTSALDVRRQLEVMETVLRVSRERRIVTIVAIHDLSLAARFADTILLLSDGRIARAGEPHAVLADPSVAETYAVGVHLERSRRGTLLVEPYLERRPH